jgi:hypothetical protein
VATDGVGVEDLTSTISPADVRTGCGSGLYGRMAATGGIARTDLSEFGRTREPGTPEPRRTSAGSAPQPPAHRLVGPPSGEVQRRL